MEERILNHLDIDTRRVLGLPPRRLPKSELNVRPEKDRTDGGTVTIIRFNTPNTTLFIHDYRYHWIFGFTETIMMFYDTKRIYRGPPFGRTEEYIHPDFNDDGSFKRA